MTPDTINGLFEFTGSIACWYNVYKAFKDKQFRGVSWAPTAFFASWGFWNLYYYPSLHQTLSFLGGISLVIANTTWLGQMFYYGRQAKQPAHNDLHGREVLANQPPSGGHQDRGHSPRAESSVPMDGSHPGVLFSGGTFTSGQQVVLPGE